MLKPFIWFGLAVPGLLMSASLLRQDALAMDLLHPSGELSARLLVLALLPGPLAGLFGPNRFLLGWLAWRRNIGVAAFAYAALHLGFYLIDIGALSPAIDELGIPSIWTGWLALLAMIPPAVSSIDRAMIKLGRQRWKSVQRLVYVVAILTFAHWLLLDWHWQPALVHASPIIAVWLALVIRKQNEKTTSKRNYQ